MRKIKKIFLKEIRGNFIARNLSVEASINIYNIFVQKYLKGKAKDH